MAGQRFKFGVAALVLLVAACGGDPPTADPEPVVTEATDPIGTTTPAVTTALGDGTPAPIEESDEGEELLPGTVSTSAISVPAQVVETEEEISVPSPVFEGPPVPDLTFQLDDGTVHSTTDTARPTLYLFWAEW
ncbi:MAG: hypothetical protein F4Z36_06135 [Acidimicrobiia bacterium]|nr:hypothetical protein [bacterium]MXX64637.1 hypothetical protein [Acidimicrobiia bacterium]